MRINFSATLIWVAVFSIGDIVALAKSSKKEVALRISALQEADYKVVQDGAACWLAQGKNHLLYDSGTSVIRINDKGYALNQTTSGGIFIGDSDTATFEGDEGKLKVTVKKNKKNHDLFVNHNGKSATVKGLKKHCGD